MQQETSSSDQDKLAILKIICEDTIVGQPARFGFNALTKTTHLSKVIIDNLLVGLARNKFITQYAKKGVDSFTVILNQKGLEAVQDGSFI